MSDGDELALQVGDTLQLQYVGDESRGRFYVKVIGYLASQSLVVTTPRSEGRVVLVREGQPFIVRLLAGNKVVGFNTSVLRVCARPYPYLHLAFPASMEQTVVRKAQRVRVKLLASVQNDNPETGYAKPQPAVIADLSTAGALVVATAPLGAAGDVVTLAFRVRVGAVEQQLKLAGSVCSVREEPADETGVPQYQHGMEFRLMEPHDELALHGFVYEQIARGVK